MNKTFTRTFLIAVVLLVAAGAPAAFAQVKGAFAIVCDITGARVYLNGELAGYTKPTFSQLLTPGQYSVRVSAPGYRDYLTTVQMTSNPLTLNVVFKGAPPPPPPPPPPAARHNVTITCNVGGAQVYINNNRVGVAPVSVSLEAGSYTLRVSARGHGELNEVLRVRGDMTYSAVLQGRQHRLSVTANVAGAQVYVNDSLAGTTPFNGQFAPGSYNVRVTAPGFQEASATVNLARDEALSFVLQSGLATVNVHVNPVFLDPQHGNPLAQVKVYIDGRLRNGFSFQLPAGRHNIRVSSGGLSVAGDFELAPGRTYTIEPTFGLTVR